MGVNFRKNQEKKQGKWELKMGAGHKGPTHLEWLGSPEPGLAPEGAATGSNGQPSLAMPTSVINHVPPPFLTAMNCSYFDGG